MISPRHLRPAPRILPEGTIRVAFVIDSLGYGGAEALLVRYLQAVPALGVEPTVIVIQDRDGNPMAEPIRDLGVPIVALDIDRLRRRGALERVTGAIASTRADLVHTQLEFANILGTLGARRLGIPALATLHTLDRPRPRSRDAVRFRLMARVLRHRSSSVIAVSDSAARHFAQVGRTGSRLLTTIHNGIDLRPFTNPSPEARPRIRSDFGIPPQAPVVTTVAVLRQPKGIGDMIDALPTVLAAHPGVHYLVVGEGEQRRSLLDRAAALGIDERVHLAGHRSDIPDILAASDLFVLPSHTEALPTVLIEAMAAGVPIVATDVGGIPEMVDHGVSALLVPAHAPERLSEAVSRILGSPLQAQAMAKAGRRTAADRFDITRQAARLVDEYRRLVAGGGH